MSTRLASAALALVAASAAPVFAAGPSEAPAASAVTVPAVAPSGPKLVFALRGGVAGSAEYFGSDSYVAGPDLGFSFKYLDLGKGRSLGNPDPWAESIGFGVGGSFRFIQERTTADFSELAGLDDVDAAVELGVSVRYGTENFLAFGNLRRGFGGHEGWVGEVGADAILKPTDRLRLNIGPRVFFGDETYSNTYFGITPAEASATLPAYELDGGMVSAGVELGARYQINDLWGLEGAITWQSFSDDVADSPIVKQGSEDQWGIRFGVTRVFSIGG